MDEDFTKIWKVSLLLELIKVKSRVIFSICVLTSETDG